MESLSYLIDAVIIIRVCTGAVMCVYGYKWRKGLISIMATYIGAFLGMIAFAFIVFMELPAGIGVIIALIITISFVVAAYINVTLNHFLTGFLVSVKLLTMIIYFFMEYGIVDYGWSIIVAPIILSVAAAVCMCHKFTYMAVVCCMAYIGAVEVSIALSKLINGTLFIATGDFGFIFDPILFILSLFGIDLLSVLEILLVIILFVVSVWYQKKCLIEEGINLDDFIIDDRNNDFIK